MSKNIVILCDGTGNEIGTTISNVLKLYRMLDRGEGQRVFYSPGIGTIGLRSAWQRITQRFRGVFGLVTGQGLDEDVLAAYRFLAEAYSPGDRIMLFGFSRGAYTVRVLAAFLDVIGLLSPDQANLAGHAFSAYKRSSMESRRGPTGSPARSETLEEAWQFGRIAGTRPVRIHFIGVWDTVASIIVPRADTFLPDLQTLRFTRTNPAVACFRQAIAIDERRRMFRLNRWTEPQVHRPDPFDKASEHAQDVRQVWFAGVHADVGGGYPEVGGGLSKFPLIWMVEQAIASGLMVDHSTFRHLAWGEPRPGGRAMYVPPDAGADAHESMTAAWWSMECIPKRARWREWRGKRSFLGWYLPLGEPRLIPDGALIHGSVFDRMDARADYRPVNIPVTHRVEPWDVMLHGSTPSVGDPSVDHEPARGGETS